MLLSCTCGEVWAFELLSGDWWNRRGTLYWILPFSLRSFLTGAITVIQSTQNRSGGGSDMGNAVSWCNPSHPSWAMVHISHPHPSARLFAKDINSGRTRIMLWRHAGECLQMHLFLSVKMSQLIFLSSYSCHLTNSSFQSFQHLRRMF